MYDYVSIIIDNLEGGYYHPDMQSKLKNGANMLESGETMFGFDRKTGGTDVTQSTAGLAFWNIIDKYYSAHHTDIRYYNDKADGKKNDIPAEVGVMLKAFAKTIMDDRFKNYSNQFLTTSAKQIVNANPALTLQFYYACYNGAGNFQKFANIVNTAIQDEITDPKTLYSLIQEKRRNMGFNNEISNNLFARGADKLDDITQRYFNLDYSTNGHFNIIPLVFVAALAVWLISGKKK